MQEVPRRKALWLEVGAVAGFVVIPSVAGFFRDQGQWQGPSPSDALYNWDYVAYLLAASLPILFIMWSSGDGLGHFGFPKPRAKLDIPVVLVMTAIGVMTYITPWSALTVPPELKEMFLPRQGFIAFSMLAFWLVAAFFEEFIYRGYLIPRLEELSGNVWTAVVVSAFLFAIGHLYQGFLGAFHALGFGLAYGIAFVARPNVWPLAVAHAATNVLHVLLAISGSRL